jgi:hypothetical protein
LKGRIMGRNQEPQDQPGWEGSNGLGVSGTLSPKAKRSNALKIFMTVTVVLALGVGFYLGRSTAPKTTVSPAAAQTAGPVTASPSAAVLAPGGGSTTAAASSSTDAGVSAPGLINATGSGTVTLVSLTAVSGNFDNADKSPVLNGKAQLLAVSASMGARGYGCTGPTGETEYNLGRNYTQLSMLLGVDDNSSQENVAPTVEIDGDGLKLDVYTPTLGHDVQVTINVTGMLRLDIKWSAPNVDCSVNYLVLGDALLTSIPGYTPPPPTPNN